MLLRGLALSFVGLTLRFVGLAVLLRGLTVLLRGLALLLRGLNFERTFFDTLKRPPKVVTTSSWPT